jgi:hypothetical protein
LSIGPATLLRYCRLLRITHKPELPSPPKDHHSLNYETPTLRISRPACLGEPRSQNCHPRLGYTMFRLSYWPPCCSPAGLLREPRSQDGHPRIDVRHFEFRTGRRATFPPACWESPEARIVIPIQGRWFELRTGHCIAVQPASSESSLLNSEPATVLP